MVSAPASAQPDLSKETAIAALNCGSLGYGHFYSVAGLSCSTGRSLLRAAEKRYYQANGPKLLYVNGFRCAFKPNQYLSPYKTWGVCRRGSAKASIRNGQGD